MIYITSLSYFRFVIANVVPEILNRIDFTTPGC